MEYGLDEILKERCMKLVSIILAVLFITAAMSLILSCWEPLVYGLAGILLILGALFARRVARK